MVVLDCIGLKPFSKRIFWLAKNPKETNIAKGTTDPRVEFYLPK